MENDTITAPSPEKLQAQSDHATLTEVFKQHHGGWADTEALQSVRHLRFRFPHTYGGYIAEKIGSVESWAAILYSDRKHARWGVDGVERIRSFIWQDLQSLEQAINRME